MSFWKNLLPKFGRNAKNAALETAIGAAVNGKFDANNLDDEALAVVVFTLATQLHQKHPHIAGQYGWARLVEVQAFTDAIMRSTPPPQWDGLQ
jgi:hypothetical protein